MNGHAVPESFLARKNNKAIVITKFEGDIIRLKELYTHGYYSLETETTSTVFV